MPTNPTDAQREASRRNGAASRGPKSDAGKARSALNGLKHGFRAATVVLSNESQAVYDQLRESYILRFQPADQFEHDLVAQMVNAVWRLRRVQSHESALLDVEMFVQHDDLGKFFSKVDSLTAQALAFKAIAVHDPTVAHMLDRQESRYARQFERAHRMLLAARRQKRTAEPEPPAPPEPVSPIESTVSETDAAPAQNPEPEPEIIPDSNAAEQHEYQRYEYQPGQQPFTEEGGSRFESTLRKPDGGS